MSSRVFMILGAIMVLVGAVWIFQGVGYLGGSFMTGQPLWAWIGAGTAVVGVGLLLGTATRRG